MTAADLVAQLWTRFRPVVEERVALLERYAGGDPDVSAQEATTVAHKLAGGLGSYGRPAGSDAARTVEHLLLAEEQVDGEALVAAVRALRRAVTG